MTIEIKNVTKFFDYKGKKNLIFKDASCKIPTKGNIAILGLDGSGKSALMSMFSNVVFPNAGNIEVLKESVSWPVAYKNCLPLNITAEENIDFITMLQESNPIKRAETKQFIYDFCKLKIGSGLPFKLHSKSMKARLYFATCFAFNFDTYILDDFNFEEDTYLYENADEFIQKQRPKSRVIFTSKNLEELNEKADHAVLIKDYKIQYFAKPINAIEEYKKMLKN